MFARYDNIAFARVGRLLEVLDYIAGNTAYLYCFNEGHAKTTEYLVTVNFNVFNLSTLHYYKSFVFI